MTYTDPHLAPIPSLDERRDRAVRYHTDLLYRMLAGVIPWDAEALREALRSVRDLDLQLYYRDAFEVPA